MDSPLSTSTIESLPNDLLAAILKLVADSPIPSKRRIPPFPITFSSVSRRFRYLALASPELWTTIRLSHRSRCWKWAAIFLERSGSRPLDISINLEAYRILFTDRGYGFGYSSPIRIMKALAIVGPHIHRWRTLAIRLDRIERLDDLVSYILQSSFPATSKLESLHVSVARGYAWYDPPIEFPQLAEVLAGRAFGSLRTPNARLLLPDLSGIPTFNSLDIVCDQHSPADLCSFLGPLSPLKKLVLREFSSYWRFPITQRFDACTVTTLSISLRSIQFDSTQLEFVTFTNTFNLPKLEQLELTCAFIGIEAENRLITIPEDWEAPLFPTLHTLRLVKMGITSTNLALIQSLSQEITTLHLIHTSGNEHLLTPVRQDGGWPSLSSLTVETEDDPSWLPPFLAARSGISTLTISPALLPIAQSITSSLGPNSTLNLRILSDGPSPSFAEFASPAHTCRFYYDDDHLGISDFEYTEVPFFISSRSFIHPAYWYGDGYSSYRDKLEENQEITEDWYAGNFSRIVAELGRTKGALRERKRGNAQRKTSRRRSKGGRRHRTGCALNLKEMFDSYM